MLSHPWLVGRSLWSNMEESTSERESERAREQERKRERTSMRVRAPATATHYRGAELCARFIDRVYMENTWKYVRDGQSHQPWPGAQCATFSWSLRSRGLEMATPDSKSVVPHGLVVSSGRESGHPVDMAQRWWLGRHSSVRTCPWQMDRGTVGHLWGEGDTDFTS